MSSAVSVALLSHDQGLVQHWGRALPRADTHLFPDLRSFLAFKRLDVCMVWVDLGTSEFSGWTSPEWKELLAQGSPRVVATSSNPKDAEAIAALDAGCAAYCHAFADTRTLAQVDQVVRAGHVWIGPRLMQRLIQTANLAAAPSPRVQNDWNRSLTPREQEVAVLAAKGESNQTIAQKCAITERTVKAHLSAVFEKLGVSDRLQLTLKVHGIQ